MVKSPQLDAVLQCNSPVEASQSRDMTDLGKFLSADHLTLGSAVK